MATVKKNKYIEQDLEWLKAKFKEQKQYIDSQPFNTLADRKGYRPTKYGEAEYVIATKEKQREDLSKAILDNALILDMINKLEQEEEKKKTAIRGDEELTPLEDGQI